MVNSKLSKKSLKSRSLKLKNKKYKVSKKNVRKMKGGAIDDEIKELFKHFVLRYFQTEIMQIASKKTNIQNEENIPNEEIFKQIYRAFLFNINSTDNQSKYKDYLNSINDKIKQNLLKSEFDKIINTKIKLINERKASRASKSS